MSTNGRWRLELGPVQQSHRTSPSLAVRVSMHDAQTASSMVLAPAPRPSRSCEARPRRCGNRNWRRRHCNLSDYILGELLTCAHCGSKFIGTAARGNDYTNRCSPADAATPARAALPNGCQWRSWTRRWCRRCCRATQTHRRSHERSRRRFSKVGLSGNGFDANAPSDAAIER